MTYGGLPERLNGAVSKKDDPRKPARWFESFMLLHVRPDLEIDMKGLLVSIDLEMNQPSEKIIQVGAALGNVRTVEVTSRFDVNVNPNEALDSRIIRLTGIRQSDVDNAGSLLQAYQKLSVWLVHPTSRLARSTP